MNKREQQKEERRQKILEVSLETFVRCGYHGTTIRGIAKEVGMSPGLMFHYFETKDDLYIALLQMAVQGIGLQQSMQDIADKTPLDIISEMCEEMFKYFHKKEVLLVFVLVKQALYADFLTTEMKATLAKVDSIEQMVPLIVAGQQMGQFKAGDPLALSTAFFSAIQGIAETKLCFEDLPLPKASWIVDILKK